MDTSKNNYMQQDHGAEAGWVAPPELMQIAMHDIDLFLLHVQQAPYSKRMALLANYAVQAGPSELDRRKGLLAIKRLVLNKGGDSTKLTDQALTAINQLASTPELRVFAIDMLVRLIETVPRTRVLETVGAGVKKFCQGFIQDNTAFSISPSSFVKACRALKGNGNPSGAAKLAGLGLLFFPYSTAIREVRAKFEMAREEYDIACNDFDKLVELHPKRTDYRLIRARCYKELEEYEKAIQDLNVFLANKADYPRALQLKADCLALLGKNLEAIKLYDRLIVDHGNQVGYLISRSKLFDQADLFHEAAADLDEVLEGEPTNQEAKHLRQSLLMRSQSYGMEDDLYTAFSRGDEEFILGNPIIPETRFKDIGGLDKVKQLIKETILYPYKYQEISELYGKTAGGGMLLFGPPGCGKTMIAKAAAGECGVRFINVNLATILDKWVGNSEKAVSMVFKAARKHAPSIVFLDEIDALGGSRETMQAGWEKKLISQLLVELDGLTSDNSHVMLLAATNAPWDVDFALRRPGRLGKMVFVPPPEAEARNEIIRIYLARKPLVEKGIDIPKVGQAADKFSADAIKHIVESAASIPWREAIDTGKTRAISQADLALALKQATPDLAEWERLVSRYKEFADQSLKRPGIGFLKKQPQTK